MASYVGDQPWQQVYVGDKLASAAYLGPTQVWGPQIGDPIEFLAGSLGSGRNGSTGSNKSAIGTMLIDEDLFDRYAVAFVAVSHDNWLNSVAGYGTFTLTSHLDGQFTRLDSSFFGRGGNSSQNSKQGSVTPFVLRNPTVGMHSITAYCQGQQWINSVEFQVQAYCNVLSVSTPVMQTSLASVVSLALSRPMTENDIALCGVAHDRNTLSGYSYPQRGSTIGGPVDGRADYLTVLEAPGIGGAPTAAFTSATQAILGAAAVTLVGYPQAA